MGAYIRTLGLGRHRPGRRVSGCLRTAQLIALINPFAAQEDVALTFDTYRL